jgi:hypothetical protein
MTRTKSILIGTLVLASTALQLPRAQMRVEPLDDLQGHTALGLVSAI